MTKKKGPKRDKVPATDNTAPNQNKPHLFQPGQSGNPKGRPKGSRSKLSEAFITELSADFDQHGAEVIVKVREKDPAEYLKLVARIVPKDINLGLNEDLASVMAAIDGRTRGLPGG